MTEQGTDHLGQTQARKAQSLQSCLRLQFVKGHEDWLSSQSPSMCLLAAETLSWHQLKRLRLSLKRTLKSSMLVILSDKVTRCQAGRAWPLRLSSGFLRVLILPLQTSVPTGLALNFVSDTENWLLVRVKYTFMLCTWNQPANKFWICGNG